MNSADRIHRALVSRHADLNRYASGLSRKTLAMLDKLGKGLARDLMDAGLDATRTDWQRARLRSLLKAVQERTGKVYADIAEMHASEMSGLVEVSGAHITTAINGALGADLLIPPKWTAEQLAAIASDVLVDGAPSAEWWSRQADGLTRAFADQMRQGMLRGENVAQLRDRILGQNLPGIGAVGKVDLRTVQPAARGLIQTARRNAEGLVRSSVISTANAAHLAVYQANADIMEGMAWCATLDMRTCLVAGTPVSTPCGPVPIELIKAGDAVLGGSRRPMRAVSTMSRKVDRTVKVTLSNGETVQCTTDHLWLKSDQEWVEAKDLKSGDVLAFALK